MSSPSDPEKEPAPEPPTSYVEWGTTMLRKECLRCGLKASGFKYQTIRTLVEDDRKTRALQPRVSYNTDDPDGSLRVARGKKEDEDKWRDRSAVRAELEYLNGRAKRAENAVKRTTEAERVAIENAVNAGIMECPQPPRPWQ